MLCYLSVYVVHDGRIGVPLYIQSGRERWGGGEGIDWDCYIQMESAITA